MPQQEVMAVMRDPAYVRDAARAEKCVEFVKVQSQRNRRLGPPPHAPHHPVVTISRQAGTAAHVIGDEVAAMLKARFPDAGPWAVFDRNLVDRVIEEHDLPRGWAEFMPEDRASEIADTVQELFGLRPGAWTLVHKVAETMLHLAELGHVVLIGRGANVITGHMPQALHVRLIGSLDRRVARVREVYGFDESEARAYVHRVNLARTRYVKKYLARDIDDPLQYHLVVNTDRLSREAVARLIADTVSARVETADPVRV